MKGQSSQDAHSCVPRAVFVTQKQRYLFRLHPLSFFSNLSYSSLGLMTACGLHLSPVPTHCELNDFCFISVCEHLSGKYLSAFTIPSNSLRQNFEMNVKIWNIRHNKYFLLEKTREKSMTSMLINPLLNKEDYFMLLSYYLTIFSNFMFIILFILRECLFYFFTSINKREFVPIICLWI